MPEILKQQNYSVCDRLDNFCQECIANNYQDCSDHGGWPSGDSTVLGKRRVGDNAFEDFPVFWNKQGGYKKKGDTKPASKRTNASADSRSLLKNTVVDHNGYAPHTRISLEVLYVFLLSDLTNFPTYEGHQVLQMFSRLF